MLMFSQATGSLILFLMVANGDLDPVLFIFGVAVPLQFCRGVGGVSLLRRPSGLVAALTLPALSTTGGVGGVGGGGGPSSC